MHVVTIEYKTQPIIDEIFSKLQRFRATFGIEPQAILLGPNEQISLTAHFLNNRDILKSIGYPETFAGLPIRVKVSGGIDFELKPKDAIRFAKGQVVE